MFAYCNNNPINHSDPCGSFPLLILPAIIGTANNIANAIYYEFSSGESDLSSDSYVENKPSRWDKLDYTKAQTGEEHYNINSWRYYSEYSLHEYGWYITKWAYDQNIPVFSSLAASFSNADVFTDKWDPRLLVNTFTIIWGMLGF